MRSSNKPPQTVADAVDSLLQGDFSESDAKLCREIIDKAWYTCEERNGGYHPIAQELYGVLNFLNDRILPAIRCHSHETTFVRQWLEEYIEENLSQETMDHVVEHRPFSRPSVKLDAIGSI